MNKDIKIAYIFSFRFSYPFLESFLIQIAQKHSLHFSTSHDKEKGYFILSIQAKEQEIRKFSDSLAVEFPLSLFFCFQDVNLLSSETLIQAQTQTYPSFPLENQRITPQDSIKIIENSYNLKKFPYGGSVFLEGIRLIEDNQEAKPAVVSESFRALVQKLKNGEEIYMQTLYGAKIITLDSAQREWIMPCDSASLELLFRVNNAQSAALLSFEKPIVFLSPKTILEEEMLKNKDNISPKTALSNIIAFNEQVIMPYDYSLHLLAYYLREYDIDFCYLYTAQTLQSQESPINLFSNGFLAPSILKTEPATVVVSDNSTTLIASNEPSLLDYPHYLSLLIQESGLSDSSACLHASYHLPTMVGIFNETQLKKILHVSFPLQLSSWVQEIINDKVGAKLVQNYIKEFSHIENILLTHKTKKAENIISSSSNIFDVLGIIYQLLYDYQEDIEAGKVFMLKYAEDFLGSKGPRIDYKLYPKDGGVALDHLRILRSCMSFRLAGVDKETLAFGVIDSMAEFYGNLMRDVCDNFILKNIVISGSMLSFNPFFNRLLHFLPPNIPHTFPIHLPLDCIKGVQ